MSKKAAETEQTQSVRKSEWDGVDRRQPVTERSVVDRRSGLDRRRGPGRRRTDYRREAEEGRMNDEQLAFIMAMEEFKSANGCPFPTWTDVLDVALYLGYRKVAPIGEHQLTTTNAPDDENDDEESLDTDDE